VKPYIVAFIFARGGSKGVPRKNIRLVAGKPLIGHAIETARASTLIHRVIVSTEDQEIADVAREWGAEVPFLRPAHLARDDSPEWLAWQHAIGELTVIDAPRQLDLFTSVPTTSPLRSVADLDRCIRSVLESDADAAITVRPAERSPYFNMVCLENGYARLVIPPVHAVHRRQDVPEVFDMTTVAYAARPEYVLRAGSLFEGKVRAVIVPPERAIDIDTELDIAFAEYMMARSHQQPPETQREIH
jgi:N,N'-diacetyl-8-epilegionaminate cytidylyltransferase